MRSVFTIIDTISDSLKELRSALEPLATLSGASAAKPRRAARSPRTAPNENVPRKRRAVSPKLREARALQGRYMGLVRSLPAIQKAQVKKAKAENGYDAAFKVAAGFAKKQKAS